MNKKWMCCLFLGVLGLVSCSQSEHAGRHGKSSPFDINGVSKRLNTADCQDVDDWYLDGFRVGKTFNPYHQKLFQQRVSYCQQYGEVSDKVKLSWMDGYKKGAPRQASIARVKNKAI